MGRNLILSGSENDLIVPSRSLTFSSCWQNEVRAKQIENRNNIYRLIINNTNKGAEKLIKEPIRNKSSIQKKTFDKKAFKFH
jgi:hypothetical protein